MYILSCVLFEVHLKETHNHTSWWHIMTVNCRTITLSYYRDWQGVSMLSRALVSSGSPWKLLFRALESSGSPWKYVRLLGRTKTYIYIGTGAPRARTLLMPPQTSWNEPIPQGGIVGTVEPIRGERIGPSLLTKARPYYPNSVRTIYNLVI